MKLTKGSAHTAALMTCLVVLASCSAPADPADDETGDEIAQSEDALSLKQLAADSFGQANENPLSSGGKWRGGYAGTANFQVVANGVRSTSTTLDAVMAYVGISTPKNQYIRVAIKTLSHSGTTSFPGALLRLSASPSLNGYDCRVAGPSASRIGKWVNGHFTQFTWQTNVRWAAGDAVQCEAEGTSIRMYRIRAGAKTLAASASDATHVSGNAGLISYSGASTADVALDDVSIGSVDSGAVVAAPLSACLLPLGDSITQTNASHVGYRYRLWEKLEANHLHFNFVGSMNTNHLGSPTYPNPAFDRNHEGHWGWRADQLLANLPSWLTKYTPGVALIHVGSNDVFQGQSNASTIAEIGGIIDALRHKNPHVAILLAKLIPASDATERAKIVTFNGLIPGLASSKNTAQSPVRVVDQYSGFDPVADTFDGVHPDDSGERKMAQRWYDALVSLTARGVTPCP